MLREASVAEMNKRKIPKYSRILVNRGRDNDGLAPNEELYREMMNLKATLEKELGKGIVEAHNKALTDCDFERRFRTQITTDPEALRALESVVKRAKSADIYLVCYEGRG